MTLSEKKDVFILVSYVFWDEKCRLNRKIWFYKNLRKKDVESTWQFGGNVEYNSVNISFLIRLSADS